MYVYVYIPACLGLNVCYIYCWEVAFGKILSFLAWAIFQTELEVCITVYRLAVVGEISDVMYACLEMRSI